MISLACADGGLFCLPVLAFLAISSLLGWRHHKRHHCCDSHHDCKGEAEE